MQIIVIFWCVFTKFYILPFWNLTCLSILLLLSLLFIALVSFIVLLLFYINLNKIYWKTKITDYSVIIPVKNEATNIVLCIKSILKQSFSPHKIIIVDDHSTDDILEILENNF